LYEILQQVFVPKVLPPFKFSYRDRFLRCP